MNNIHYTPWTLVNRLHRAFDPAGADDFAAPAGEGETHAAWQPAVDVHEEADRFVVRADLPGVDPKDIQVTADEGVLVVRGTRAAEAANGARGYQRSERPSGRFIRRFSLPETVDAGAIRARHANGVLEVAVPKQARPEPRRVAIEVN